MAVIYSALGDNQKALEIHKKVLSRERKFIYFSNLIFCHSEIFMKLLKTEDHLSIATTLSNIAFIYSSLGQTQKALKKQKRVYSKEQLIFSSLGKIIFISLRYQNETLQNRGTFRYSYNNGQHGYDLLKFRRISKISGDSRKSLQ